MEKVIVFILCFPILLYAQLPTVTLPTIPTPTQSIYLSPSGNDNNPGTMVSPKLNFSSALSAISYGTVGVDGGNAYAEVVLLPGNYYPKGTQSFTQQTNNWRQQTPNGYVYKNVSIRGEDEAVLHGDSLNVGSQMIYLVGNGVSVKNLKIRNSKLHGVLFIGSAINHHKNALVENVDIDSCKGFGILFTGYDYVQANRCTIANACLENYMGSNGNCQWASGLRADVCAHVTFTKDKVFKSWGEGVNLSLSKYINVQDNEVFDNYSVNVYCHSAASAVFSHNLIYNVDSTYWRYCYNSGGAAPSGISCANELTCTDACFGNTNSCGALTSCCAAIDYDHPIYQFVPYKQIDSVFIFNNILLNSNISIWDAFSGFGNYANISNVFIENNTLIGLDGKSALVKTPLSLTLNTPFVNFKKLVVANNIFAYDTMKSTNRSLTSYVPSNTCNGNWQAQLAFGNNMWIKKPVIQNVSFATDIERKTLPQLVTPTLLSPIVPNVTNPALIESSLHSSYIVDDYYHHLRTTSSNVGAIEVQTNVGIEKLENQTITVYPNPAQNAIRFTGNVKGKDAVVFNSMGAKILEVQIDETLQIDISILSPGSYYVEFENRPINILLSFIKSR